MPETLEWLALKPGDVVSVLPELCVSVGGVGWRMGARRGGGGVRDGAAVTPIRGGRPGQPKFLPVNPLTSVSLLRLLP